MLAMLFHVSAIKNHLPRILPRFSAETLFSSTVKRCAAVLIRALKQKEKGTVLRFLSFGSPSWTRTNDPPGLRCPASACGNVLPCPLPTAAPSIAPFFSRSERSRSQQFTAMRLLSRVCAAVLIGALKQKEKGTVLRFLFWLPKLDSNQRPCG